MAELEFAREILQHADFGALVHDRDSRILFANPAAVRILALDQEEILRRSSLDGSWDVVDEAGTPLAGEDYPAAVALRTGKPVRGVILGLARPRLQDQVWITVDATPCQDDVGSMTHCITTFRVISADQVSRHDLEAQNAALREAVAARTTDLEGALQDLRESEASHRLMFQTMAEGVSLHSRDGYIRNANPAAERILGLSLAQLRGQHPVDPNWELADAEGTPLTPDRIPVEIARKTGRTYRGTTLRVRRPGGERAWLSVNIDPIRYPGEGAPYEVVATFTDITREREALLAVERARDRLRQITEAVPGLILENRVLADGTERFPFASAGARIVLDVDPDQIIADPSALWNRLGPGHRRQVRTARDRAIARGGAMDEEFSVATPDGGRRWVRLRSGTPAPLDGGHVLHMILLDVTEQRHMAQALYDTQRREGLGVLAAGIAHNFNNMLAAMMPSLEMARGEVGDETRPAVEDGLEAARGAADLVRQLMLLAGRGDALDVEVVDLQELVRDVARICHRTFDRKVEVRVVEDGDPGDIRVLARKSQLQQVLLNLAINARDALELTPEPRVTMRISRPDGHVILAVEDNGPGIPAAIQAHLGEPFFTTKEAGKGTGLGLASAIGIVKALGGTLDWESREGEGATFRVKLPLHDSREEAGPADTAAPADQGALHGMALVVDDEPLVRKAVVRMVKRLGLQGVGVSDGRSGLDWLAANPTPSVVLVDLSMPGLSGTETLERIRQLDDPPPVIVMSGYLPPDDTLTGARAVLQKPVSLAQLRALLKEALDVDGA